MRISFEHLVCHGFVKLLGSEIAYKSVPNKGVKNYTGRSCAQILQRGS
jgi:hypothetical protein